MGLKMGTGTTLRRQQCRRLVTAAAAASVVLYGFYSMWPASRCDLRSYPPEETTQLDLKGCGLAELPAHILSFGMLKKLDLADNQLTWLPTLPPSLETLFLLNNGFVSVPRSIARLPRLRMLSFKGCRLRELGRLPSSLVWLILTGNELTELPRHIENLTLVRKLMLSNNQLVALPGAMRKLKELELLRIANNQLTSLPPWLHELPKLTWLAIAGNPAVEAAPPRGSLIDVRHADVSFGERLGEGTSSVVVRAEWKGQVVAAKMYKAELSSDGRNIDEVRASCAVDHPNVLRFLGYYTQPSLGALLEWAPGLKSLGKPPSMQTITRDTYRPESSFNANFILRVALSIAKAGAHLHSRGLAHGDLYAHNILVDSRTGDAKLADFGAAFYYGPDAPHAAAYQAMEGRAYGFLLEELLVRHDGRAEGQLAIVRSLAAACTAERRADRPKFAAAVIQLEAAERAAAMAAAAA